MGKYWTPVRPYIAKILDVWDYVLLIKIVYIKKISSIAVF